MVDRRLALEIKIEPQINSDHEGVTEIEEFTKKWLTALSSLSSNPYVAGHP
jgi:hypothetical protein